MKNCISCDFYRAHVAGEETLLYGYCYQKPPVILLMPVAVTLPKGRISKLDDAAMQAELKPASVRPLVRQDDGCASWAAKEPANA